MLASANVAGIVANMIAPHSPTSAPKSAVPTQRVIANSAMAASALGSARRELRLAEERDRGALEPVEQDRFVDEGLAVEQRHEPAARVQHLARQLGVVRFVGIEEAGVAEPPEHDDPADGDPACVTKPAER